jgi:DNA-3-methyladenine glycosylase I
LKVRAAIENAVRIQRLRGGYGAFKGWLDAQHPQSPENWMNLSKRNFVFTGGEIVNEFLMSIGYLSGAHASNRPINEIVLSLKPAWNANSIMEN